MVKDYKDGTGYPCNKCMRNGACTDGCEKWVIWFKMYWRALRIKYGMDKKAVKKRG